jgi:hypothetical protein
VVHVPQSRRLHRSQVEDGWVDAMGCVELCYPCFAIFILLGPRGIVVIFILLGRFSCLLLPKVGFLLLKDLLELFLAFF